MSDSGNPPISLPVLAVCAAIREDPIRGVVAVRRCLRRGIATDSHLASTLQAAHLPHQGDELFAFDTVERSEEKSLHV